jgi:hypothetical protein
MSASSDDDIHSTAESGGAFDSRLNADEETCVENDADAPYGVDLPSDVDMASDCANEEEPDEEENNQEEKDEVEEDEDEEV